MQRSSRLMASALSIFLALALFCSIHAETIIVDSFDGPEIELSNPYDTYLTQKDVSAVLGGQRDIVVSGAGFATTTAVVRDGQFTAQTNGGEGVTFTYGGRRLLNQSFELDARFELDFVSAPWTLPRVLTIVFSSDGGDSILANTVVNGGADFTVSVLTSEFVPQKPEVNPLAVLNNVDSILVYAPVGGIFTISEIRVEDERTAPPGDFDFNGELDVADVDLLTDQMRIEQTASRFDIDGSGLVDFMDLDIWVHDLKRTWFGDVNLDGEFNSSDLTEVFAAGKFETGQDASWTDGDWDADGVFGTGDLVVAFQDGGFEQGPRAAVSSVPEPSTALLLILAAMCTVPRTRRKRF